MDEARYASAPLSPAESAVRQSPTASDGPYGIDNSTHLPHFEVPACWPFDTARATQSSAAPMQPFRRGSVAEPVNLCAAHSAAAATLSRTYSAGRWQHAGSRPSASRSVSDNVHHLASRIRRSG